MRVQCTRVQLLVIVLSLAVVASSLNAYVYIRQYYYYDDYENSNNRQLLPPRCRDVLRSINRGRTRFEED